MNNDTTRLKETAISIKGLELFGHLDNDANVWTVRDKDGVVFEVARNDPATLNVASYLLEAKPDLVLELIRERDANGRMLVNACAQMGAIGHALDLDMDADGDEMLGTVQALMAANKALLADLKLAAETLRRYETLHRAKNTDESTAKAEVNALLADRFEATIASARAEG